MPQVVVPQLVTMLFGLGAVTDKLTTLPAIWVYVVAGAMVFAEDAIFVGFAIPGETAAVLAGVATGLGHASLTVTIVVVVLAAIVGDSVGYEIGRRFFGPMVLEGTWLSRSRPRIERAQEILRRRGGLAVLLGRFTAFFRAMMPALAGASRLPYRTFLVWNAIGGVIWGTAFVLLGHLAGSSYEVIEAKVGHTSAFVLAAFVIGLLVSWHVTRERHSPQDESQPSTSDAERDAGPV